MCSAYVPVIFHRTARYVFPQSSGFIAAVTFGAQDEDLFVSLANRLTRLNRQINEDERATFAEKADGKIINQTVKDLLNAYNPDIIDLKAVEINQYQPTISEAGAKKKAQENLIDIARSTFSGELNVMSKMSAESMNR